MDQKFDDITLETIISIFIEKTLYWKTSINGEDKAFSEKFELKNCLKDVTIRQFHYIIITNYHQIDDNARSLLLSQISIAITKNDINNLNKKVDDIDIQLKNLTDKFNVLIDALSIIDQKINKPQGDL